MIRYDEPALVAGLGLMDMFAAAAFGVCCADRLRRDLEKTAKYGSVAELLRQSSAAVWTASRGGPSNGLTELEEGLMEVIPNEDDDPTFEGAIGEDACAAMIYTFHCLDGDFAQNAAWAARRAYETADRFAGRQINETQYTVTVEEQILSHEVVQGELRRQQRDFQICLRDWTDRAKLLSALEKSGRDENVLSGYV